MAHVNQYDSVAALQEIGITYDDAKALRRIGMTLHRWHELECGEGHDWGSWAIVRGRKTSKTEFEYDDDGKPHIEHHHYMHGKGKDYTSYHQIPDKENGALLRLTKIMQRYPTLVFHVQTDPRGAPLYILHQKDILPGHLVSECYSRGVAVCR